MLSPKSYYGVSDHVGSKTEVGNGWLVSELLEASTEITGRGKGTPKLPFFWQTDRSWRGFSVALYLARNSDGVALEL